MKPPERSRTLGKADEERVRQFLSTHPDFFARNPDLVERLIVPHACAPAQSLIEHQVALLRTRNRRLERRLQELIANARDNESLHRRVHALGLRLLECGDAHALFDVLYEALRHDFRADAVAVRVLVRARPAAGGREEFIDPERAHAGGLGSLLVLEGARCGQLETAEKAGLFSWPPGDAGSRVLVPMRVCGRPGVFGLASRDPQRFHTQMGTTFLEQLASVLAIALGRYVDPAEI